MRPRRFGSRSPSSLTERNIADRDKTHARTRMAPERLVRVKITLVQRVEEGAADIHRLRTIPRLSNGPNYSSRPLAIPLGYVSEGQFPSEQRGIETVYTERGKTPAAEISVGCECSYTFLSIAIVRTSSTAARYNTQTIGNSGRTLNWKQKSNRKKLPNKICTKK